MADENDNTHAGARLTKEQEDESLKLQKSLESLSSWESEMSQVDTDAEIYRIKKSQPMYAKRRQILKQVPKFWYIILAENDDFADYISPEDLKYLEYIDDIHVQYRVANGDGAGNVNPKDFEITISFAENSLIPQQSVTKEFYSVMGDDGEEHLKSKPVSVEWPKELAKINPQAVKEKSKGKIMTPEEKKRYRLGMKSFFAWFAWTGEKPGKEFRNGEELTQLIAQDLFINALRYYIVALSMDSDGGDGDEEDSSEGEELDLSDNDDGDKKRALEDADDEPDNKNKKIKKK
ncbi:uncharacterized protein LODBEIA_P17780 [Lodderomyces beijingensis]|uniref:Vacuolar protein sorting-associated protein 75 n=1 Tax=Lodderomyces beijingensis TaxID=1775926 RepID=A0ABP0ZHB6_9ASCO